jgi:hypothetical protein
MRNLLEVKPNGCLRLRLTILISFVFSSFVLSLKKFRRTLGIRKKMNNFFVQMVQSGSPTRAPPFES